MTLQRLGECLWAKTGLDPDTREMTHWLPLPVHLRDTAEITALLVRHRMSAQQRRLLTDALPTGVDPERIGWLLGALHDVGKSGAAFQGQVEPLAARLYDESGRIEPTLRLDVRDAAPIAAQSEFPHALASEIIVTRVLAEEYGLAREKAPSSSAFASFRSVLGLRPVPIAHQLGSVLGAHHGYTAPASTAVDYLRRAEWPARLGAPGSPWHAVQKALTLGLIEESGVDLGDPVWVDPDVSLDRAVLSLLTGLVIQADWIASNQDLFPLIPVDASADACETSAQRALRAWEQLALPSLWSAVPQPDVDDALRFRFSLPEGAAARPGQRAAHQATAGGEGPRLVILEDETGSGKTEAALLAAENLAATTGATGLFIGLPTQATANSIFARVSQWLYRLPTGGQGVEVSASLAHGKAQLSREFTALGRLDPRLEPDVGEAGLPDDAHSVGELGVPAASGSRILRPGTHAWLGGRKKRVLADFVVGTVDQLLMAALAARHVMLRHSGFADKVVLLDEVHAADTTMRVFLRHGLTWLGRWGVPVVMLTATLPPAQKRDLAAAYQEGLGLRWADGKPGSAKGGTTWGTGLRTSCVREVGDELRPGESTGGAQTAYPALTVVSESKVLIEPIVAGSTRTTDLHELADDEETLVETLRELLREGGCVAVIRNSVARVQEAAALLRVEFGEDVVTIAHARYAASDRAAKDRWLLEAFGRDPAKRPDRAIVVASQVIEQSLDIDFDAIITDMCPVDLLIQRLGRVHRHPERVRPEPLRTPRCYLSGMDDWAGSPPVPVPASRVIYGEHLLLRSVAAVRRVCGSTGGLTTPDDVLPLVHTVYGDSPVGPDAWQAHLERAAADQDARDRTIAELAERLALHPGSSPEGLDGWLSVTDGDPEDADPYNRERGHVRDGAESIEVLLVLTDGTGWRSLDWLPRAGGRPIPEDDKISRSVAEAVAGSSVRLPFAMAQGIAGDRVIAALERWGKPGLQRSPLLRGQLILPLILSDDGRTARARVDDWDVVYDRYEGLSAHRWAHPAGRSAFATSEGDSA